MSRFQGIGTAYYGKKDYDKNNDSYIITKWFVFFLLPIVPLKSYRVREISQKENFYGAFWTGKITYQILKEIPLKNNKNQIIKTYLYVYSFLALLGISIYLTSIWIWSILFTFSLIVAFLIWWGSKGF